MRTPRNLQRKRQNCNYRGGILDYISKVSNFDSCIYCVCSCSCCWLFSRRAKAAFRAFSRLSVNSSLVAALDFVQPPLLSLEPPRLCPVPENAGVDGDTLATPRFIDAPVGTRNDADSSFLLPLPPTGESSNSCLGSRQEQQFPISAHRLT